MNTRYSTMEYLQKKSRAGFTLIELLVVVAIVGVLSGVVLQSLNSARANSRDATRLTEVDQLNKAFELSATGGTNSLPSTGGNYYCLGLTADTSPTCSPSAIKFSAIINTTLSDNIANKAVPRDSKFLNGIGTAYLYNSSVTPNGLPAGAYLSWVMEGTNCGRGQDSNPVTSVANGRQCFLRIGNAI